MSDGSKIIIKDLIKSGRLVTTGVLSLDGEVVFQPTQQEGNADEFGFLPPETDFGGQQNEKVNELREQWLNSGDKFKAQAANEVPHLFVVITEHYNPDPSSDAFRLLVHNNNSGWPLNVGMIYNFKDFRNRDIEGHLFMGMGNFLILEAPGRESVLDDVVETYEGLLKQKYNDLYYGTLADRYRRP